MAAYVVPPRVTYVPPVTSLVTYAPPPVTPYAVPASTPATTYAPLVVVDDEEVPITSGDVDIIPYRRVARRPTFGMVSMTTTVITPLVHQMEHLTRIDRILAASYGGIDTTPH